MRKRRPSEKSRRRMTIETEHTLSGAGSDASCNHRTTDHNMIRIHEAGLDGRDLIVMQTARLFFESFANPDGCGWMTALECPGLRYGQAHGSWVATQVLACVQAMRKSRQSCFRFNSPHCTGCSQMLSEHERLFMQSFKALRQGRRTAANSFAVLLCEMNPVEDFLDSLAKLVELTDALDLEEVV